MPEVKVGKVTHFFNHISVAGIDITEGELKVGDTIHIKGHTTDFTEKVESIQIESNNVEVVKVGDKIGIKTKERVREHDEVFVVTE